MGENYWRTVGENLWRIIGRKVTIWNLPVRRTVSKQEILINMLLSLLEEKSILSKEEIEKLKEYSQDHNFDVGYGFFEVEDIDERSR